jgi:hypothetical protein
VSGVRSSVVAEIGRTASPDSFAALVAKAFGVLTPQELSVGLDRFVAGRTPAKVSEAVRLLHERGQHEVAEKLVAAFGRDRASDAEVVHLARLRADAAYPREATVAVSTRLWLPRLAVDDPVAAVAVMALGRHAGGPLTAAYADRARQALRLRPTDEPLAVVGAGLFTAGADFALFTAEAVYHQAAGLRRRRTRLDYSWFGRTTFTIAPNPSVVAVRRQGLEPYFWTFRGADPSRAQDVVNLLNAMRSAVLAYERYARSWSLTGPDEVREAE